MGVPLASPGRKRGPRVFALIWLGVAAVLLFSALWTGLLIAPSAVRVLVTLALVVAGLAALVLFSDGFERGWSGRRFRRLAESLHWFSTAVVALAIVVVLGGVAPSIIGPSPSSAGLIVSDVVLGAAAGGLTLLLTALTALLAGRLARILTWLPGGHGSMTRLDAPLRDQLSWRAALRTLAVGVAGMLATTWVADHVADWPSMQPAAADVAIRAATAWNAIWLPLIAWFVATGVAWVGFSVVRPLRPEAHERRRRATRAGALAVGLAVLVGVASASLLNGYVRGRLSSGPHRVPSASGSLTAARASAIAHAFSPRLVLDPGERWDPTAVSWYVANSHITKDTTRCRPRLGSEPDGCRTLNCPQAPGLTCSMCDDSDPGSCAPRGDVRRPYAYYEYLDAKTDTNDRPAREGHDWAVIEYWLFYNYDSLEAGLVTQWHQADWEQVSVLVEQREGRVWPVEVAFSEHCYGAAVPAAKVQWQGTHPVSYVGLGSHANYPTNNDLPVRILCLEGQPPRYLGAAGLLSNPKLNGSALELPLVNLIGLHDQTGDTPALSDTRLISAPTVGSFWKFRGYWGLDNNLHILFGRARTGPGPTSPQDQGPWTKPFDDMLCGPTWLRVPPVHRPDTSWIC
jgi:hypothetical protein